MCRLPCLPEGYISYNSNVIQATNEFQKSTIKGETTPATNVALALAAIPATYTSNIPSCCFASIKFSIKSDISSKSSPWGGDPDKNWRRWGMGGDSHVLLRAQAPRSVHVGPCVRLQPLTDSIIMSSAIICSHQCNIKAITCVSAFSVVIKANSTAIYLRCVNITALSPPTVSSYAAGFTPLKYNSQLAHSSVCVCACVCVSVCRSAMWNGMCGSTGWLQWG